MPLSARAVNKEQVKKHIEAFDFEKLFITELGWDHNQQALEVPVQEETFKLTPVAQKRGFAVYLCSPGKEGRVPDYTIRRKIESGLARTAHEHLIIFVDASRSSQFWQWVKRSNGRVACRENIFYKNQQGEILLQKLQPLAFSLDEEEELDITRVLEAVTAGFDTERVTRKFYDLFQKHHDKFLKFIEGIPDKNLEPWYVSVILNRLMFIYFIQKKGFLDGNINYLDEKLKELEKTGKNKFYSDFLCPLFFEGLAKKEADRPPAARQLLGNVPYLNGGIFAKNQLEELHGQKIKIPDAAFKDLFGFFEQYQWHLDDRPVTTDNEINPDVLGYIFEKYINQKQMGAYYTKEDITGYISRNTIIPFIFDSAQKAYRPAFDSGGPVWNLVKSDPDRYFYDSVKKGVNIPLPQNIAAGLDDVSKREDWNKHADSRYALPTEIWRETVARRQRYEEIKKKIQNGEIKSINDFITYNLNIELFAQDVIENCPSPELLRAFWKSIENVSVLDPTCGSGAFLFAALNILDPLYEACLVKMQDFVNSSESPAKFPDFRLTLENIHKHSSEKYFIYKSIILKNLYGVDIMEEAVEICKLRLFLKLVAQVEDASRLEPLPDIDFNIRSGNTLVGFSTFEEAQAIISSGLDFEGTAEKIRKKAEDVERLFKRFRQQQTEYGGNVTSEDKKELHLRLKEIDDELNKYLAGQYKIDPTKKKEFDTWLQSHKPFHWFVEFYGIMTSGGFDVVIGNPPYVEYSQSNFDYKILNFSTGECGNLYAFVMETSTKLLTSTGHFGMIIPISLCSTARMRTLRDFIIKNAKDIHYSSYADRPTCLFNGVHQILSICVFRKGKTTSSQFYSAGFHHWLKDARPYLFKLLKYAPGRDGFQDDLWGKFSEAIEFEILSKLQAHKKSITAYFLPHGKLLSICSGTGGYWLRAFTKSQDSSEYREQFVDNESLSVILAGTINSSLFYWLWRKYSDCRHLTKADLGKFKIDVSAALIKSISVFKNQLSALGKTKEIREGKMTYEQYRPNQTKSLIDEIDKTLSSHYNLSVVEMDFIVNYDIKYRMGQDSAGDEQE